MRLRPLSAWVLALGGTIVILLGLFFLFLRPSLLPEDSRFIGKSLQEIETALPGLAIWLRRVFWVMGGFMLATGLLTVFLALTSFRSRARGAALVVAISGSASIGWMAAVNFIIVSDFKWLILVMALLWVISLGLYLAETRDR